jgi:hypothetical protein
MSNLEPRRAADRARAHGAAAVSLAALGLLLFVWPFVRTPPLDIGASYLHLMVSWVLVVTGLALLARSLGRGHGAGGHGA